MNTVDCRLDGVVVARLFQTANFSKERVCRLMQAVEDHVDGSAERERIALVEKVADLEKRLAFTEDAGRQTFKLRQEQAQLLGAATDEIAALKKERDEQAAELKALVDELAEARGPVRPVGTLTDYQQGPGCKDDVESIDVDVSNHRVGLHIDAGMGPEQIVVVHRGTLDICVDALAGRLLTDESKKIRVSLAPKTKTPKPVVCDVCDDTHHRKSDGHLCGYCPVPCTKCAQGNGLGAYCAVTPCPCDCGHRGRNQRNAGSTTAPNSPVDAVVAEVHAALLEKARLGGSVWVRDAAGLDVVRACLPSLGLKADDLGTALQVHMPESRNLVFVGVEAFRVTMRVDG